MRRSAAAIGWSAFGAAAALVTIEAGSLGLIIVVALLVLLPAWRQASHALVGAATLPLWIGYRNRGGPGTVCETTANAIACGERLNPWPWLGVGLALLAAAAAVAVATRRGRS